MPFFGIFGGKKKHIMDDEAFDRIQKAPKKTPKSVSKLKTADIVFRSGRVLEDNGFHFKLEGKGEVVQGVKFEDIKQIRFELREHGLLIYLYTENADGSLSELAPLVGQGNNVGIEIDRNGINLSWQKHKKEYSCRIGLTIPKRKLDVHIGNLQWVEDNITDLPGTTNVIPKRWLTATNRLCGWDNFCKDAFGVDILHDRVRPASNKQDEEKTNDEAPAAEGDNTAPAAADPTPPTNELTLAQRFEILRKADGKAKGYHLPIMKPLKRKQPEDATELAPKSQCDENGRRLAANDSMETVFSMIWILPLLVIFVFWFKRYIVTRKNNDDIVEDNANEDENSLNNIV